jgi:hypothetical protein
MVLYLCSRSLQGVSRGVAIKADQTHILYNDTHVATILLLQCLCNVKGLSEPGTDCVALALAGQVEPDFTAGTLRYFGDVNVVFVRMSFGR